MAGSAPEAGLPGGDRVQTVAEFTRRVKELLQGGLPACWVRGEVSNLRAQSSGHVYFSLKDATAQLSCVLFRSAAQRQSVALRDGLQVVVFGEVGVYEARGQYQLVVQAVIEAGVGRLHEEFERLKRQLGAEGLFAAENKVPLPALPRTVGFVTSPTGAAVQDFIRILRRRGWTGRLVVLPARVQGEGAAAEMAAMLREAEALGIFDLLVIGRGGGSVEDLWAFNEETLVRAVAACPVPIISAVGHEVDWTLCDLAADVRAETPSAAAELITSRHLDCVERLDRARAGLDDAADTALERAGERLDHARSRLRLLTPVAAIQQHQLRLDDLANRLTAALGQAVQRRREQVAGVRGRLAAASPQRRIELESHRLLALWKRLESANPASVLKRGFAIVRDESGRPVARAAGLAAGRRLENQFHDGRVKVKVE